MREQMAAAWPVLVRMAAGVAAFRLFASWSPPVCAADSICARVQIEIAQEATLERQAFDAHMRISNGLPQTALEQVGIQVSFTDSEGDPVAASSDPNDATALFFIRTDSLTGIDHVDGSGTVAANTTADIHWLIVPAPGASNGLDSGTLYYVGATLTYTMGGRQNTTEVTPDWIRVKPMPEMALDYFLPADVYGDDAFTPAIEPPVPFSLGLRVSNRGHGTAWNLKVDSAQPRIVDNDQGLLVGFVIEGSEANGAAATPSLKVDLGDVRPSTSATARWLMTCSLSGRFTEFTVECSHADELGGELTSLVTEATTHTLVHDVLVDLAGRDGIRDFLAADAGAYRVYESNGTDTAALDQSAASALTPLGGGRYTLTTPVTAGFLFVQLPDPSNGGMVLREAVRSDGKRIKADNAWLSKTRVHDDPWQYSVCLFDTNSPGSYTLTFASAEDQPQPPVLQFIADQTRGEGRQLSFIVEATDPDGTIPSLTAAPLPVGATFTDRADGTGVFDWTPAIGQAGTYQVTFTASDGVLTDAQAVRLTIFPDSDGDGLDDDWERLRFGDLTQGPDDDYDGDTETNLVEFVNGTDPADARSTYDPANAYVDFRFEIWRAAEQTGAGGPGSADPSWGATLACRLPADATFTSGTLAKPEGAGGANPTALVAAPGVPVEARFEASSYASADALGADFPAGTYRVDLRFENGARAPARLLFKIAVPPYEADSFPPYVAVAYPAPGATDVPLAPLLEFSTPSWDRLSISDVDAEVYSHSRTEAEDNTHQMPPQEALAPLSAYTFSVGIGDWGTTWLRSITRVAAATGNRILIATRADDVVGGRGIWDLSGTYDAVMVGGHPLALNLVHDARGRLTGTATYSLAEDGSLIMPVRGAVEGVSGSIVMKGAMRGDDSATDVSVSLTLNLTVDPANRELTGRATGGLKTSGTTKPVDDEARLRIPGDMDGTWALSCQLDQSENVVTGTALLTLSNDVEYSLVVKGKADDAGTVALSLTGAASDPAAKGIKLKAVVTQPQGGPAAPQAVTGRAYGQTLAW